MSKAKKYPQKVRFKGAIDGVENPVFELDYDDYAVEYWLNVDTGSRFELWQVHVMPDKFEPVTEYPAKVRYKFPLWGIDGPILTLDRESMAYFWRGPLGEYAEVQADVLIGNTDKFEPVEDPPWHESTEAKFTAQDLRNMARLCLGELSEDGQPPKASGEAMDIYGCVGRLVGDQGGNEWEKKRHKYLASRLMGIPDACRPLDGDDGPEMPEELQCCQSDKPDYPESFTWNYPYGLETEWNLVCDDRRKNLFRYEYGIHSIPAELGLWIMERQKEPAPEPGNPAKWTDADMISFGRSCWSQIKGAKRPKNSCGFRTTFIEECLSRFKESRHD